MSDYHNTGHDERGYSMVQECCESYEARRRPDGGRSIHIEVDPRFASLWLTKLADLRATDEEIAEHEQGEDGPSHAAQPAAPADET